MIIGVLSDTHDDEGNAIPHIVKEFKKRGVQLIVHCGDIKPKHVSKDLFAGLPVYCAFVDGQKEDPVFRENCPEGWDITFPKNRIRTLPDGEVVYIGHKRHMYFLRNSTEQFGEKLMDLRQEFDGLRFVFGGHMHFQTFKQGQLVSFINPGAVQDSLGWGYEYAIVDTVSGQVIFSRILPTHDDRPEFSVGVISDSLDISHRDNNYWRRLAKEFNDRGVSHIIHCGNIAIEDIGRQELSGFSVHYAIRADQFCEHKKLKEKEMIPSNWAAVSDEHLEEGSIVDINGFRFYVQLDLGLKYMTVSEAGMDSAAMQIRRKYPGTEFVLCGFTREAVFVEGGQVITINPGDVNTNRNFAVICLPRREITFGNVGVDPLPKLPAV
jgi:putative phosphoesterase